jgi:hypothetical protein
LADLLYLLEDPGFNDAISNAHHPNVVVTTDRYKDDLRCKRTEGAMRAANGLIADDMLKSHARGRPMDSHRNEILDPIPATENIDPKSRGRVKFITPLNAAKWRTRGNTEACQRIVNGLVMFYAMGDPTAVKRQVETVRDADPAIRKSYQDYIRSRAEIMEDAFQPPPPRGLFRMFKWGDNLVWAVRQPNTLPARLSDMAIIGATPVDLPPFPTDHETWTKWHRGLVRANLSVNDHAKCVRNSGKQVNITTWRLAPMTPPQLEATMHHLTEEEKQWIREVIHACGVGVDPSQTTVPQYYQPVTPPSSPGCKRPMSPLPPEHAASPPKRPCGQ